MIITAAAIAGMIGPALFGTVLLALSALQYDFMLGIGWQPIADPAGAWPSALALGPYGLAQVANFVLSGSLLAFSRSAFISGRQTGTARHSVLLSSSWRGQRWH